MAASMPTNEIWACVEMTEIVTLPTECIQARLIYYVLLINTYYVKFIWTRSLGKMVNFVT